MKSRQYSMTVRGEASEQTTQRILAATAEAFWANPDPEIPLSDIADRAGVTTRTILRKFGSKENLLIAAAEKEGQRVQRERETPVGDVAAAVKVLIDHYEDMGVQVLAMLAARSTMPGLAPVVDGGKAVHRQWCTTVFAPYLDPLPAHQREVRLAQFVAVCDVYMWQLLRLDCGLSRPDTEHALLELLAPLTKE